MPEAICTELKTLVICMKLYGWMEESAYLVWIRHSSVWRCSLNYTIKVGIDKPVRFQHLGFHPSGRHVVDTDALARNFQSCYTTELAFIQAVTPDFLTKRLGHCK